MQLAAPKAGKQLQALLGFSGYLRDYIPLYAKISAPLERIKNLKQLDGSWGEEQEISFRMLKDVLSNAPILSNPCWDLPMKIATDASQLGIGAVLYQEEAEGKIRYIGFYSKALSQGQRNYSATKRELLAIMGALRHFRHYIYGGKEFEVYTDHKALTYMFTAKELPYMLHSWIEELMEYKFVVIHRPGAQMVLPDALSRLYMKFDSERGDELTLANSEEIEVQVDSYRVRRRIPYVRKWTPCVICQRRSKLNCPGSKCNKHCEGCPVHTGERPIIEEQSTEESIPTAENTPTEEALSEEEVPSDIETSSDEESIPVEETIPNERSSVTEESLPVASSSTVVEQPLTRKIRLDVEYSETATKNIKDYLKNVVNKKDPGTSVERQVIVDLVHSQGHQGAHGLFQNLFRLGYFWPEMKQDCVKVSAICPSCLRYNISVRGFHPLRSINAMYPFDHLCMDLGQITPTSAAGTNCFLVVVDVCTRFLILRPLENKSARLVAEKLCAIFYEFGLPKILHSDNGSEFRNKTLKEIRSLLHFEHRFSTVYYPQSNGCAESMVKKVKHLLRKRLNGDYKHWCTYLPSIQLGLNTQVLRRHKSTPFSLMFTRPCNAFQSNEQARSELMTIEKVQERNSKLIDLLYPAIQQATDAYSKNMVQDFQVHHRILNDGYPNGSMVMKLVDGAGFKGNTYEGPFKIINQTKHNTYVLLDATGVVYPHNVPPSSLKLISVPEHLLDSNEVYEVERVLKHRGAAHKRQYLVKWKGQAEEENSWVEAKHFDATDCIRDYWSRVRPAEPKKRGRPAKSRNGFRRKARRR